VLSRRAEFSDEVLHKRFFTEGDFSRMIITTPHARASDLRRITDAGAQVLVAPATSDGDVDLRALCPLLEDRGVRRVLAEGGPSMNRRLLASGLLDELFLTVSMGVAGGLQAPRLTEGSWDLDRVGLSLISELQYRDPGVREWYLRFSVSSRPASEPGGE
jgi:riboflavin biosynthesis pyrimidine reductase